ncbi:uncharacterized protein LOC144538485 [Centroberyx gerrardi]
MVAGSANLILGLPLNGYILWLILTKASGTMASEFFSLNLAVAEIFFCLSTILYFLFVQLKSIGCYKAYIFSVGLIYTGRPLFQCCICVERYVGVVYPVVFLRYKPLRYRVACCSVAWLMVLASCIYSEFTLNKSVYLYGFFVQNLLLLAVMLFCCLSVLRALKRPGPGGEERKRGNNMKRRAFKIILLIMISMTSENNTVTSNTSRLMASECFRSIFSLQNLLAAVDLSSRKLKQGYAVSFKCS